VLLQHLAIAAVLFTLMTTRTGRRILGDRLAAERRC
jgi:hypothetical protein